MCVFPSAALLGFCLAAGTQGSMGGVGPWLRPQTYRVGDPTPDSSLSVWNGDKDNGMQLGLSGHSGRGQTFDPVQTRPRKVRKQRPRTHSSACSSGYPCWLVHTLPVVLPCPA